MTETGYILSITRGHNGAACLLKDGKVVWALEEERYSRAKYDGTPLNLMMKVLEYTPQIDYLVIAHTQPLAMKQGDMDYTGEDVYTGLARKFGLIQRSMGYPHPQVVDLSHIHHKLHAACAFYRSGFDTATAVIIDGAGTFAQLASPNFGMERDGTPRQLMTFETESIIECSYPATFHNKFKHHGTTDPVTTALTHNFKSNGTMEGLDDDPEYQLIVSDRAGIVKTYEAVTEYCGFSAIEAGKTMGLAPYGDPSANGDFSGNSAFYYTPIDKEKVVLSNRNIFPPTYPNSALFNYHLLDGYSFSDVEDITTLKNRKNAAWYIQEETQQAASFYIRKAYEMTGNNNIVVSGGYGLNCVANYHYLDSLQDLDLNLYVEPISSDAGTCVGAALMWYHFISKDETVTTNDNLYLGPEYDYTTNQIKDLVEKDPTLEIKEGVSYADVVDIITDKNIVAFHQGRSENGPRALGNRSILYDPTDPNGKDHVNSVKRREYFRPFAGSILQEDAHEWFDLRGMESSPHMMYAVNCKKGVKKRIPSIIHEDGSCRIQTVTKEENKHYYNLIKAFKDKTGVPIIFNTSFNLGGEPLVETIEDAIRTITSSQIEYLYLPEFELLIKAENLNIS